MPSPPSAHRYPCDNCGASLIFSPGLQSLECPYCGHIQKIGPGAVPVSPDRALQWDAGHKVPQLVEIPLEKGLNLDAGGDLVQQIRTLSCPNCGARFELDADSHATTCPFCATPVVTDTGTSRQIKPQGVLPFVVTEEQARAALEDWMGRLWFAPSGLLAYSRRGRRMTGVYSPFWTFDAETSSGYSGARGDWYYETVYVTETVNGQTRRVPRQVRRTRWTPVRGRVSRAFNDVLVLAATALPRRMTDALTPWDLSHLHSYSPQFLSGFEAEGYTIPLASGHDIARREMEAVILMDVRRDIGGDEQRVTGIGTDYSAETFKHILLPIWSAAYRYNGNSYRFLVNGQSGRVQGERPWSVWKLAGAIIAGLLLLALLLAAAERSGVVQIGNNGAGQRFSSDGGYTIQGYAFAGGGPNDPVLRRVADRYGAS
ncbi:MAG: zinc ribbon domain-containing protein [Paracoccus sp. (in: a-proteobacteria)]|nr:zinc ribbon domain-containing protein [Paracoccus sp. (in: a-proteobacteria)]